MISPAAELANLRRRVNHKCAVCGASFRAIKTAVYCSNACRQKAKYQRGKDSDQ